MYVGQELLKACSYLKCIRYIKTNFKYLKAILKSGPFFCLRLIREFYTIEMLLVE